MTEIPEQLNDHASDTTPNTDQTEEISKIPRKIAKTKIRDILKSDYTNLLDIIETIDLLKEGKVEIVDTEPIKGQEDPVTKNSIDYDLKTDDVCLKENIEDQQRIFNNPKEEIEALKKDIEMLNKQIRVIEEENLFDQTKSNELKYYQEKQNQKISPFEEIFKEKVVDLKNTCEKENNEIYALKSKELNVFYSRIPFIEEVLCTWSIFNRISDTVRERLTIILDCLYDATKLYGRRCFNTQTLQKKNKLEKQLKEQQIQNNDLKKFLCGDKSKKISDLVQLHTKMNSMANISKNLVDFRNKLYTGTNNFSPILIKDNFSDLVYLSEINRYLVQNSFRIIELNNVIEYLNETIMKKAYRSDNSRIDILADIKRSLTFLLEDYINLVTENIEKDIKNLNEGGEEMVKEIEQTTSKNNEVLSEISKNKKSFESLLTSYKLIHKKHSILQTKISDIKTETNGNIELLDTYKYKFDSYIKKHGLENISIDEATLLFKEYDKYKQIFVCSVCKKNEKNTCIKVCMHLFCADCVNGMMYNTKKSTIKRGICGICKGKFKDRDVSKIYF